MNIGEKIVELRKGNNYTQEKLADKLNITRQTLSNWESNITSPDLEQAKRIAELFNISLDDLVNIKLEIDTNKSILNTLIDKECLVDSECFDLKYNYTTKCKIIDVNSKYVKIEYIYKKEKIVKIIEKKLIKSICYEMDGEE